MRFLSAGITSTCTNGLHENQDKFGAIHMEDAEGREIVLAAIADGISRSFNGKLASYNTILWLLQWAEIYFTDHKFDLNAVAAEIHNQVNLYNRKLNHYSENHSTSYTCCTMNGLITNGNEILFFNAGDSRIYEINPKYPTAVLLTKDDKDELGRISMHVGGKENDAVRLSFSKDQFHADSVYFLATDGMYHETDFSRWKDLMLNAKSRPAWNQILEAMVDDVRSVGEDDDVSAIIITGRDRR